MIKNPFRISKLLCGRKNEQAKARSLEVFTSGEARKDACCLSSIKQDSGGEEEKLLRHDVGPTSHTRNACNKGHIKLRMRTL